jgi:hypothetical protein
MRCLGLGWSEVVSQILTLSREGRWDELKDFLVRRGISIASDNPCIVRKTFIVICVGDRVTIHYRLGAVTGVVAGFSMDGTSLLLIGCRGERMCQVARPVSVYLPHVSTIYFREYSPFHESYGAKMLMDFVGSPEGSDVEG